MRLKTDFLILFLFIVASAILSLSAQGVNHSDTAARTLDETEKLFLQRNFLLLAAKYEISAADAAIIQSKLYPNPNLSIDQGLYNKELGKWFDLSKTGETSISLQQVILLGGKRSNQINVAKRNAEITAFQFYELVRNLRYELRTSFYNLYFLQQTLAVYDKEIESLKSLIDAYTIQFNKGNIAFSELARLQALQFGLENERIDLIKNISENQSKIILITGDSLNQNISPLLDTAVVNRINASGLNYSRLLDSAKVNRYDMRIADATIKLNEAKYALQKSMRVPDLTLGANWDKQGSYIPNYNSITMAIDLPFFNRNQGNIKIAEYQLEESKNLKSQAELQVSNDLKKAYDQFLEFDRLFKSASSMFSADYTKLLDGINKGYRNRTINLLEFIDYYETYKNSVKEFNQLQNNRLNAIENVNLAVGIKILN